MMDMLSERRISTKAFIGPMAIAVVAGVVLATICFMNKPIAVAAPIGLLPIVWVAGQAWLSIISHRYRLFGDRIEMETGILSRKIENIDLFRVRDVGLRQSLLGRIAGYGDVYLHSTDSSTPVLHLRGVDDPTAFYQQLRELVSNSRAQMRTMIVEQGAPISEP